MSIPNHGCTTTTNDALTDARTGYNLSETMSKLKRKFEDHLESLYAAVDGEMDLRDNYKLYQKVQRFYTKDGVTWTGDSAMDYNMVVNYLNEDLYS